MTDKKDNVIPLRPRPKSGTVSKEEYILRVRKALMAINKLMEELNEERPKD